jgi:lysozyme family protein
MKYTAKLASYYRALWDGLEVSPARAKEAEAWAKKILANKSRYKKIEQATGVPWHFVALAHYRESTLNFQKNLCNGQPLNMRTTIVPKGRGPYESFEESAYDALVRIKGYNAQLDWSVAPYIHRIEGYNGYGYHGQGIPSPYLVGGSNKQMRGKYTRDHYFDPGHWDTQLGVLTLLKSLIALDPSIRFGPVSVPPKPKPKPQPKPDQPEPEDKPGWFGTLWRKIWGTLFGGSLFGGLAALTDWQIALAVFGFILVLIGIGLGFFFWIYDAEDVRHWLKKTTGFGSREE